MDNLFYEKLDGFAEEPPAYLWNNIQSQLAGQRRKVRIFLFSWSAVAALLVLAFIAGWYFSETAEKAIPQRAETEIIKPVDEKNPGERGVSVLTDVDDIIETEEKETLHFPADAATWQSIPYLADEKIRILEVVEESMLRASADLALIERIEVTNIKVAVQKAEVFPANRREAKPFVELTERERKITCENSEDFARTGKESAKWKMGLNVSPGYSSYTASHSASYASNMTYDASDGNSNMSGGVSVQYKTGKRLHMESGVYYAQNGQQSGSLPQFFGLKAEADYSAVPEERLYFNTGVNIADSRMAINSTAGIIEFKDLPQGAEIAANLESSDTYSNSLLTSGEFSQVFDFVEIPLCLRYLLLDSKMDVELIGGIIAGLVVGNNAYIKNEYGLQNIGKTSDISTMNVSGTLGLGLNYALGKHLSLAVEPRLNYYLNSINRNPDVDYRPYRVGVYTGLYYEF